jgi:hypothetical protein
MQKMSTLCQPVYLIKVYNICKYFWIEKRTPLKLCILRNGVHLSYFRNMLLMTLMYVSFKVCIKICYLKGWSSGFMQFMKYVFVTSNVIARVNSNFTVNFTKSIHTSYLSITFSSAISGFLCVNQLNNGWYIPTVVLSYYVCFRSFS